MVLRVHKVPHPGCAAEEGITTHPPTARPGLQSVLLQFNQRSYRRVVEYVRGVRSVHARRLHRGPTPKQSTVRGRINRASAGAQSKQGKHSPRIQCH
jgi:hypothetical protein